MCVVSYSAQKFENELPILNCKINPQITVEMISSRIKRGNFERSSETCGAVKLLGNMIKEN